MLNIENDFTEEEESQKKGTNCVQRSEMLWLALEHFKDDTNSRCASLCPVVNIKQ
jgi:hypothetical protein